MKRKFDMLGLSGCFRGTKTSTRSSIPRSVNTTPLEEKRGRNSILGKEKSLDNDERMEMQGSPTGKRTEHNTFFESYKDRREKAGDMYKEEKNKTSE